MHACTHAFCKQRTNYSIPEIVKWKTGSKDQPINTFRIDGPVLFNKGPLAAYMYNYTFDYTLVRLGRQTEMHVYQGTNYVVLISGVS